MSNKKVLIGSLATVVAAGALGASVANAHLKGEGKRGEVKSAIESNDYNAFKDVASVRLQQRVDTQEDFSAIVEAHQLRAGGRPEAARAVLENAGIEWPGHHGKYHNYSKNKKRGEMRGAVEAGDWKAFQELADQRGIGRKIDTEEKFDQFVEAHQLRSQGRYEESQEIMDDLGVSPRKNHRHHK